MYAQKRPIENTHITREKDRQRFRELLAVLCLGFPLGLFLLLFTWQNLEVIRLGREATRLKRELKDLEETNKRLRIDIEHLTSLAGVEEKAGTLGFTHTDSARIVAVVPQEGVSRVQLAEGVR